LIGSKLGHFLDRPLGPFAKRISLAPNVITIAGFIITAIAAAVITFNLRVGGLLIIAGGLFDMLDGIIARTNGKSTAFGAFLDSTLDRYSDAFIFIGVAWYFFNEGNLTGVLLTAGSLVGALLVSYVRARAEGLAIQCKLGFMERPERVVLLSFGCITGLLFETIAILFVFSHFTVIQRIAHVYRETSRM
jgi:phosphatidylglycerophosphate synthase